MTSTAEERDELAAVVARLLASRAPIESMPDVAAQEDGYDRALWRELAEYGLLGLLVPESIGGAGATSAEMAVVAVELGRALVPGPYLSSAVQATTLVVAAAQTESSGKAAQLLERLVAGDATAVVVDESLLRTEVVVRPTAEGDLVLDGAVSGVIGADAADQLFLPVQVQDTTMVLSIAARDVATEPAPLADVTRRAANVSFDGLVVPREAVVIEGVEARSALDLAASRLAVGVAADSAGGAGAALARSTDYAKTRHQFGRAIGSFQAIKHKLADMYIAADSAAAMAERAAEIVDDQDGGAHRAVLAAAAHCTSAYISVAGDAIQTHGGIGFTWEHVCHRYLKRAWLNQTWLGGQRALTHAFADSLFTIPAAAPATADNGL